MSHPDFAIPTSANGSKSRCRPRRIKGIYYLFGYLIQCDNERIEIDMRIYRPALIEALDMCETSNKIIDVSSIREGLGKICWYNLSYSNISENLIIADGLSMCSDNLDGYKKAIEILGPEYSIYLDRFKYIMGLRLGEEINK